jgi:hypothetical protein
VGNAWLSPSMIDLQQIKKTGLRFTAEVVPSSILNGNGYRFWETVIYEIERQRIVNQRNDYFGFH